MGARRACTPESRLNLPSIFLVRSIPNPHC